MTYPQPDLATADQLLVEASALNPGFGWSEHSRVVSDAAGRIAAAHPQLDENRGRMLGLLHDIGRRAGRHGNRHIIDGYVYLAELGYDDPARICLTHSFPVRDIRFAAGTWDTTAEEYAFIDDALQSMAYDDYDRLIQLCDAIALPSGFCLLEQRLVDIGLRHGVNERTVARWQAIFEIKGELEQEIGRPIYDLLPGVIENTFRPDA